MQIKYKCYTPYLQHPIFAYMQFLSYANMPGIQWEHYSVVRRVQFSEDSSH